MSSHRIEYKDPFRRIIVCCDGTAHSAIKGSDLNPHTNVFRFSRCIKAHASDGSPQIVGYVSGIGTSAGNPLNKYLQGTGIVVSTGIDEKIKEAYTFICHNYVSKNTANNREVEIFLIGFSRGAFVARCVADLIDKIGVLNKMGTHYLPYIYDMWRKETLPDLPRVRSPAAAHTDKDETNIEKNRQDFRTDLIANPQKYTHRDVRVKVCAVWDTVASIGPVSAHLNIFRCLTSRKLTFVNSSLCDSIDYAIQALSLHEHRRPFYPIVWKIPKTAGEDGEVQAIIPRLQQWIVKLEDSMSKRYWLAGSYYRKPFRSANYESYETIHITVKLCNIGGVIKPPRAMETAEFRDKEYHFTVSPPKSLWRQLQKALCRASPAEPEAYNIEVDRMTNLERHLLSRWLQGEVGGFLGKGRTGNEASGRSKLGSFALLVLGFMTNQDPAATYDVSRTTGVRV
ncbi:hypothetical protein O1611_g3371 [Lasiodiplodia mahajangana]|uniref:Uncharacterized protein n=1 Tax=Lasiodiplodia mahajangana TaxID=1108764 RepID=A0ACC2JS02_9PEZI|nr:hypothetical protein O1611_g3371 [Lasiodiplodia mahajangana]